MIMQQCLQYGEKVWISLEANRPMKAPDAGNEWVQGKTGQWYQKKIKTAPKSDSNKGVLSGSTAMQLIESPEMNSMIEEEAKNIEFGANSKSVHHYSSSGEYILKEKEKIAKKISEKMGIKLQIESAQSMIRNYSAGGIASNMFDETEENLKGYQNRDFKRINSLSPSGKIFFLSVLLNKKINDALLKKRYGPNITLYRGYKEGDTVGVESDRFLSFTDNPSKAKIFTKFKDPKIIEATVPIKNIWFSYLTDDYIYEGENEFTVFFSNQDEIEKQFYKDNKEESE